VRKPVGLRPTGHAGSTIVAIGPSVAPLLSTRAPCAFERESATSAFRPSGFDFALADE
jgi:hypothetical protein